jgi:hypothetical protein
MRSRSTVVALVLAAAVAAEAAVAPATADTTCTERCWVDMAVAAPGWPTSVPMGTTGELTWTATNIGGVPADRASFGTASTAGLSITSARSDVGICPSNPSIEGSISCQFGTVAPGQTITVHAQYDAVAMRSGALTAHVGTAGSLGEGEDPDQSNDAIASPVTVTAPLRRIATIRAATTPQRILKTGGLRVRVMPAFAGTYGIDAAVHTAGGSVSLVHVDLRNVSAGRAHDVFLGTLPSALARIRRALRSTSRLRALVTVTDGNGLTARATIPVQA